MSYRLRKKKHIRSPKHFRHPKMTAVTLPAETFNLPPVVGKSFYEDLTGGTDAAITVQNNSTFPVELVVTRVNAPVVTYVVPGLNSLTISVRRLLVAALKSTPAGTTFGTIQITKFIAKKPRHKW